MDLPMQHIVSGIITQLPVKPLQTSTLKYKKVCNNKCILKLQSLPKLNKSSAHHKEKD